MNTRITREKPAVWASGLTSAATGVGVFQRQIYSRLSKDFALDLRLGPSQERTQQGNILNPGSNLKSKDFWNFVVQVAAPVRGQVAFITTTPTPMSIHVPLVGVIYDLRWLRTRDAVSRWYRRLDLNRMIRLADSLVVISDRVRSDLLSVFPEVTDRVHVVLLGPGNVDSPSFSGREPGTVLLIGMGAYKRNELAARALAIAQTQWAKRFVGLNVSLEVKRILEGAFGATNCEWFSELSPDAVAALYKRSETFICLSMEEGFGLPFIEALSSGCNVIAIRQPLTEAILADSAILLENGGGERIASQLASLASDSWPTISKRKARAAQFSWDGAAHKIALLLDSARQSREDLGAGLQPGRGGPY